MYLPTRRLPLKSQPSHEPLTIFELAVAKYIPPHFLDNFGVIDGQETYHTQINKPYTKKGVTIPYFTMDGQPYSRHRLRIALSDGTKYLWNAGSEPIIPYGLERLHHARKVGYLIIVEGESDCWTLWLHGLTALGLPGATSEGCLRAEHVLDIAKLYLIAEPDVSVPTGQGSSFRPRWDTPPSDPGPAFQSRPGKVRHSDCDLWGGDAGSRRVSVPTGQGSSFRQGFDQWTPESAGGFSPDRARFVIPTR